MLPFNMSVEDGGTPLHEVVLCCHCSAYNCCSQFVNVGVVSYNTTVVTMTLQCSSSWTQCRRCPGDRELFTLDWCVDLWCLCLLLSRVSLSLLRWSLYSAKASNLCWVRSCSLSLRAACRSRCVSLSLWSLVSRLCEPVDKSWSFLSWLGEGAFKNWLNFVGCPALSSDEDSTENNIIQLQWVILHCLYMPSLLSDSTVYTW